jgi:hypothetical protein
MQAMARAPRRPRAHDPTTAEAEQRLLRLIVFSELHRSPERPRSVYTTAMLAGMAELGHALCCRALYRLVRRGDLRVEFPPGGGFRLMAVSARPSDRSVSV